MMTSGQAHLLAVLSGAEGSGGGLYTLNLMFSGLTAGAGGSSIQAGFSTGGHHVLGTLTTPEGDVFHLATDGGSGPALTLADGDDAGSGLLQANGSLRFCADASCETLLADAVGTLALSASCAADSDCSGFPGSGTMRNSAPRLGDDEVQIYSLALPPQGFPTQDSPEVPEPSTYFTAGLGLIGLAMCKRGAA